VFSLALMLNQSLRWLIVRHNFLDGRFGHSKWSDDLNVYQTVIPRDNLFLINEITDSHGITLHAKASNQACTL